MKIVEASIRANTAFVLFVAMIALKTLTTAVIVKEAVMGQTMHDIVKQALLEDSIKNDGFVDGIIGGTALTPEKYRRMWEKITGKNISLKKAEKAINH